MRSALSRSWRRIDDQHGYTVVMTPEEKRALLEEIRELKRRAERMIARQPESKRKVERARAELHKLYGRR
jgi:hypothetical protein